MRVFNAFQITVTFAAAPFMIAWLGTQTFPYAWVANLASYAAYVVFFIFMTIFTYIGTDPKHFKEYLES